MRPLTSGTGTGSTISCNYALASNNAGVVVGESFDAAGVCRPTKWVNGVRSFLPSHGVGGFASAINKSGVILGRLIQLGNFDPGMVVWVNDKLERLPNPGFFDCNIYALNDRNVAVGYCNWIKTVKWDLDAHTVTVYDGYFQANALNNAGVIAGTSLEASSPGAALLRNWVLEPLQ